MQYKCYISNIQLTKENSSIEHIIPNALGGKLKSKNLISKSINSKLGNSIDSTLVNAIPIHRLLNLKRERGKNKYLIGKDGSGNKFKILNSKQAIPSHSKPISKKIGDKLRVTLPSSQVNQYLKKMKQRYPQINIEEILESAIYNEEKEVILKLQNGVGSINNIDCFRAIVKIATNYYYFFQREYYFINTPIDFIKNSALNTNIISYYYPEKNIGQIEEKELSHIIYLKGDFAERILFCYIELYNVYNFIIVLNSNYDGNNFQKTYAFDLENQKEIKRKLNIKMSKKELLSLILKPNLKKLKKNYNLKFSRIAKNNNLKFRDIQF